LFKCGFHNITIGIFAQVLRVLSPKKSSTEQENRVPARVELGGEQFLVARRIFQTLQK
jgi:hypothetical protein